MQIRIDIDALRDDLLQDCYGEYFAGGFGGVLVEATDIEKASPQELIKIAENKGIDLTKYAD